MIKDKVKQLSDQHFSDTLNIRRHLHSHPELSFKEYKTSEFVQSKLTQYGIPFRSGIVDTGIVGIIEGNKPDSRVIALRADMDALPILEENEVSYASKNKGVMHACGHDVHTASLIGASRILNELKNNFDGTIKLIFQPGEEKLPGGASLMIKEGVLENPEPSSIIGQHVYPLLPAGSVGFRPGKFMASADEIEMKITGIGGHGAIPHRSIDPIIVTAQIISALQQIVSRNCDPVVPSVLTFGSINSEGGTYNVIPNAVKLKGTFRTFSEVWRYQAHKKFKKMAIGMAESMGAKCEIIINVGYPYLTNNKDLTLRCREAAISFLGEEQVHELPMRMTAEDFSYYTHKVHGCFYRLGTGNEVQGITAPVHSSRFNIDESSLSVGAGLMAWIAIEELSGK
jgi:amidohydrolase